MNRRILVVDDERKWRDLLEYLLSTEGRDISVADSKKKAEELLRRQVFHVALVDLRMDETDEFNTDGFALLETIRTEYPDDPMEVIVLTGYGTVPVARDAFKKYGVLDFIEKGPKEYEKQLKRSVQEALARQESDKERWRRYEALRERALGGRIITALVKQLCPPGWERGETTEGMKSFLSKILPDHYFPLSIDILGPKLIASSPPTSKFVCWSRSGSEAISVAIQLAGEYGVKEPLPHGLLTIEDRWRPEFRIKLTHDGKFYGTSCVLKAMTFEDFYASVEEERDC